jgi:hypothetical protein
MLERKESWCLFGLGSKKRFYVGRVESYLRCYGLVDNEFEFVASSNGILGSNPKDRDNQVARFALTIPLISRANGRLTLDRRDSVLTSAHDLFLIVVTQGFMTGDRHTGTGD